MEVSYARFGRGRPERLWFRDRHGFEEEIEGRFGHCLVCSGAVPNVQPDAERESCPCCWSRGGVYGARALRKMGRMVIAEEVRS